MHLKKYLTIGFFFLAMLSLFSCANEHKLIYDLNAHLKKWEESYKLADEKTYLMEEEQIRKIVEENFEEVKRYAEGEDIDFRIVAIMALGFSNRPEEVRGILTRALYHPHSSIRSHASLAVGLLKLHLDSNLLSRLLEDPVPEVRANAMFAVSRLISEGNDLGLYPNIINALKDEEGSVRNNAVRALTVLKRKDSAMHLLASTFEDKERKVRFNTAFALSTIGNYDVVEPLIAIIGDNSKGLEIKELAVTVLEKMLNVNYKMDASQWLEFWNVNKDKFKQEKPKEEVPKPNLPE